MQKVSKGGDVEEGTDSGQKTRLGEIELAPQGAFVKDTLPDAPASIASYQVPDGFAVDHLGVAAVDDKGARRYFSSAPFFISKKVIDLEDETEKWEVVFLADGKWKSLIESRFVWAHDKKIVQLSERSFPVDTINAKMIVGFLGRLAGRIRFPITYAFSSCGWKECDGKSYFAWGKKILGAINGEVSFSSHDPQTEKSLEGFCQNGNLEESLNLLDELNHSHPRAAMAIYHSLSPALMKIVGAPNYCVDIAGPSSVGKTTFSRLGAFVWGKPIGHGELLRSWNMTKVFGERYASTVCDLPIFLEEAQLARDDVQRDFLYMVVNGISRGRGSLTGTQKVRQWNTCLFSTSETPLYQATQLEGARARMISYWGSPFGDKPNPTLVKRIERTLSGNYGHIGPAVVMALISKRSAWPLIQERYETLQKELIDRLPRHIESRVANYFALVWLACEAVFDYFGEALDPDLRPHQIMEPIFQEVMSSLKETPLAERALEATKAWIAANEPSFLKETSALEITEKTYSREHYGLWRGDGEGRQVCLSHFRLERFLKEEGYPPMAVLREWKRKDWTQCSKDSINLPVTHKGKTVRMVVLKWPEA